MGQFLLVLTVAIVAAAIVFGVVTLISDGGAGMAPAEPDGTAVPLPGSRPLVERDVAVLRFDTTIRGYRMEQVDQALRRAAYDIGYKDELIAVLQAEVQALRTGRLKEADELRGARLRAVPGAVDDATAAAADDLDTDAEVATDLPAAATADAAAGRVPAAGAELPDAEPATAPVEGPEQGPAPGAEPEGAPDSDADPAGDSARASDSDDASSAMADPVDTAPGRRSRAAASKSRASADEKR